jgi:hypothetical protein
MERLGGKTPLALIIHSKSTIKASMMKRLVLLLLALFLVVDLAEDGCLAKASFVPSRSQAHASVPSPHHVGSDKADSLHEVATADLRGPPSQGRSQPVTPVVLPTFRPIDYCHFGSSGGIPLSLAFPPASYFFVCQNFLTDKSITFLAEPF